jgi:hypothetical protein
MFPELDLCLPSLCGCVPCEAWLWAALAFIVYQTCEVGD